VVVPIAENEHGSLYILINIKNIVWFWKSTHHSIFIVYAATYDDRGLVATLVSPLIMFYFIFLISLAATHMLLLIIEY
jgi:hypothetical protein